MTETEGCALLKARFEAAGFRIAEGYSLRDEGLALTLDGFDATRRVGYEYLTREADDAREFTPEAIAELERRMERGALWVLLVDDQEASADVLAYAADRFLAMLHERGVRP